MNVNTACIVNDSVKKPKGPSPRPPISSKRNFMDISSEIMRKKKVSPKNNKNFSPEKSREDVEAKNNSNSSLSSREGKREHQRHSSLYPELGKELCMEYELYTQDESYYTSSSSVSLSSIASPRVPVYDNESRKSESSKRPVNQDQDYLGVWFCALIVFIAIIYYGYKLGQESNNDNGEMNKSNQFRMNVDDLQKLFPSQNESIWIHFKSGILDVALNRTKPAVILLLAIDDETTNCLVEKVAGIVSPILGGTSYASLTPGNLTNDIDEVFTLVKKQFQETKTVVFTDILNMQPKAVRALHDICDQYVSLNEDAVYLIIMKSKLYKEIEKPEAFAERELKNSFSNKIEEGTLEALITRVTAGAVLPIKREKIVPCSK